MRAVVPMVTIGLICLLSQHLVSAEHGPLWHEKQTNQERELEGGIFNHAITRNANNAIGTNQRQRNRAGGNSPGQQRSATIPARPRGPEVMRAMRRHVKYPIVRRALNDASSTRQGSNSRPPPTIAKQKPVQQAVQKQKNRWENKNKPNQQQNKVKQQQQQQQQNQQNPQRKKQQSDLREDEANDPDGMGGHEIIDLREDIDADGIDEDPKKAQLLEMHELVALGKQQHTQTQLEEEMKLQVELHRIKKTEHSPESQTVMDVTATFIPPSEEDFSDLSSVEGFSSSSNSAVPNRGRQTGLAFIGIALVGLAGVALVALRRKYEDRKKDVSKERVNFPIRMIDENGDSLDVQTQYGMGGGASLGSRSSSESRGYMGYHL